jgi:ABC-type uncharacterized transport system substrate-binding protein
MARRQWIAALVAAPLCSNLAAAGEGPAPVAVAYLSGVEAYGQALEGVRSGLAAQFPNPLLMDLKTPEGAAALTAALRPGGARVVITIGSQALDEALSRKSDAAIVPTMILRSDWLRSAQPAATTIRGGVYLDAPVSGVLTALTAVFPDKRRFANIWNPLRDGPDTPQQWRTKPQGVTIHTAECSRAEDVVKTFLALKAKVDIVILLPDSSLYNNTTVKPLIVASLESRLPVVGFSSTFVRAGAAVGVYPDFRDIGVQTAELVQRLVASRTPVSAESPRKLQVAVNQRSMRLLGTDYKEAQDSPVVVFR